MKYCNIYWAVSLFTENHIIILFFIDVIGMIPFLEIFDPFPNTCKLELYLYCEQIGVVYTSFSVIMTTRTHLLQQGLVWTSLQTSSIFVLLLAEMIIVLKL